MLTNSEKIILTQMKEWENEQLQIIPNDFLRTYDTWIEDAFTKLPEKAQIKFFHELDSWLFYIHAAIQQSKSFDERVEHILNEARLTNESIQYITDLKYLPINRLNYYADRQISMHKLFSLIQGGVSGAGGTLFLGLDIPSVLVINLRAIQLIATTYGYDTKNPFEMMISLKLFHCATLPKRFQKQAWDSLLEEVNNGEESFFYEGNEQISDVAWLNQPLLQILKIWTILLCKKRKQQNIPFASMAIGASFNYSMTKNITQLSKRFYQYRNLLEKAKDEE
ncbi:EcsC family protein [Caldibacillus lycopersici]|uniref:EcsC family protein n=1 Tax=Perspicuibacillus lycopersici TaxID=1325689 RepID=A0AAE3IV79_9BACI|nr:EcsC family protein [Perspicuibacillus lycopersici]MCU9614208.1 EcsC family protein [Perspicuibacillus lycopersici]